MLNNHTINKIRDDLNANLIVKLLAKYFLHTKKLTNIDQRVLPHMIFDMATAIPQLASMIEVQPHASSVELDTSYIKVGWNLFVLGAGNRLFLGYTEHNGVSNIHTDGKMTFGPLLNSMETVTARAIIRFVLRTLGSSRNGHVRIGAVTKRTMYPPSNPGGQFFRPPSGIAPMYQR